MEGVRCLRVGLASTEFQSVLPSHGALEHGLLDGFRRKQYVASPVRPARRHKHGEPTASRDPFDSKHMDESGHVGSTDDVAAMPLDELRRLVPASVGWQAEAAMSSGAAPGFAAAPSGSSFERCAGGHHRRSAGVDGVDDLARIDPLQVGAGGPQVRMPELALDDVDRHTFPCELDSVPMPQLVLAPTSAQAPLGRPAGYAEASVKSLIRSGREVFVSAYSEVLEELQ